MTEQLLLKHYYVSYDDLTDVLTETNTGRGGKTHPSVEGLHIEIQTTTDKGIDYCLSTAPSTSDVDIPGVEVLTEEQWVAEWIAVFETTKQNRVKQTYVDYKIKFEELPDEFYHPYEMLYSSYIKRTEAAQLNDQMTDAELQEKAPVIYKEATERGISVLELANRILLHASVFDEAQASLLAERGKEIDTISTIECDTTSLDTIKESIDRLSPSVGDQELPQ
jgi:hypothetical protein